MRRSNADVDNIDQELALKVAEVQELTKVTHDFRQVRMMVMVTSVQLS